MSKIRNIVFLIIASITFASCGGGGGGGGGEDTMAGVEISEGSTTINLDDESTSTQFDAQAIMSSGTRSNLKTATTWTSSDTSVASIDSVTGLAQALARGTTTITISSGGFEDSVTLTVNGILKGLSIQEDTSALTLGDEVTFTAIATYEDGGSETISSGLTWNSSNSNVGEVNSSGKLSTVSKTAGSLVLSVAKDDVIYTREITVTEPEVTFDSITISPSTPDNMFIGAKQQLTATANYSDDSTTTMDSDSVTWSSSDEDIIQVNSVGLLTAQTTTGTANITATSISDSSITKTVSVTVEKNNNADIDDLVVTPNTTTRTVRLFEKSEIELKAKVIDENQDIVVNSPASPVIVSWESSDESVATVDSKGVVTAEAAGSAIITASVSGETEETDTATIEVVEESGESVQFIAITPPRIAIGTGVANQRELSVYALDAVENGDQVSLNCTADSLAYDDTIIDASNTAYNDAGDSESITITALSDADGLSLLTFTCDNITTSPIIVEVRDPIDIAPNTIAYDFGIEPSIALVSSEESDSKEYHISSYNQTNGQLVYSFFSGSNSTGWVHESLTGDSIFGHQSQIIIDSLNDGNPLICAINDTDLGCWLKVGDGWSQKTVIEDISTDGASYDGTISMQIDSSGKVWILYYDSVNELLLLSTSSTAARDSWTTTTILEDTGDHSSIALVTESDTATPRIIVRHNYSAYYGSPSDSAPDGTGDWSFERIAYGYDTADSSGLKLAIGFDNRPQAVIYRNGQLVHYKKSSNSWTSSVINSDFTDDKYDFAFSLDRYNQPRVVYYDAADGQTLRYSYKLSSARIADGGTWRTETPSAETTIGQYADIALDENDRAKIVFYDAADQEPKMYIEPLFLDYAIPDFSDTDPFSNTKVTTTYLNAPDDLELEAGDGQATPTWSSVYNANTYNLYWNTSGDVSKSNSTLIEDVTSGEAISSLSNGTTYYFKISSVGDLGESTLSDQVTVTPVVPVPQNVTATAGDASITLGWDDVSNASSYYVYWGIESGITTENGNTRIATSSTFEHDFRTNGEAYYYKIVAIRADGTRSALSEEVSATPVISTPTGLAVEKNEDESTNTITWNKVNGADSYKIYWNRTGYVTSEDTAITISSGDTTSYSHTGIDNNSAYFYVIVAVDNNGNSISPISSQASVEGLLDPPDDLSLTAGDNAITPAWGDVQGASSYNVYWSTNASFTKTTATKITDTTSATAIISLTNDTTYYVAVTVVSDSGESALSSIASATPKVATPDSFAATAGDRQIQLSWEAVSEATSYFVYWSTSDDVTEDSDRITVSSTSTTHSEITNGTTYYYKVQAKRDDKKSVLSETISSTPVVSTPSSPTISRGAGQNVIGWNAVANADSYTIYWNTTGSPDSEDNVITGIDGSASSYAHTGTDDDSAYFYTIVANDGDSNSTPTEEVMLMGQPELSISLDKEQLFLSWEATGASDDVTYTVYHSTEEGFTPAEENKLYEGNDTAYTHTGLTTETTHYYVVVAVDADGPQTQTSDETSATTLSIHIGALIPILNLIIL